MNLFQKYLDKNELDIQEMSSDEILNAYSDSGSGHHNDLKEIAERLPWIKRLKVLLKRMEEVIYPPVKGEHSSDNESM